MWKRDRIDGSIAGVKIWVLVNPRAGSGRSLAKGRAFADAVPEARLLETGEHGGAIAIARRAEHEGVDVLVSVGGDGTLQQCATGLCLDEDGQPRISRTQLLILPAGTGGDYRRTFSLSESIAQAVTRLESPNRISVDVGRIEYRSKSASAVTGFLNVMSFGLGGLTDRIVETSPKWMGGRATYLLAALRATLVHQPSAIELIVDDEPLETAPYSNVAVCLGRYFGGGMHIAPQADPSDGYFDVVTMELGKMGTIGLTSHIYRGTHLEKEGVRHFRARRLLARAARDDECLIDADGEPTGSLPLSVELMPAALSLLI